MVQDWLAVMAFHRIGPLNRSMTKDPFDSGVAFGPGIVHASRSCRLEDAYDDVLVD